MITRCIPPIFGSILFVLLYFTSMIMIDTVRQTNPVESLTGDYAEIISYSDYTIFAYHRNIRVNYDFYGTVDRFIVYDPSGKMILLDSSGQLYKETDAREIYREFRLPPRLEKGKWCLHAFLKYRPGWSIKDHIYEFPKVCAYVR